MLPLILHPPPSQNKISFPAKHIPPPILSVLLIVHHLHCSIVNLINPPQRKNNWKKNSRKLIEFQLKLLHSWLLTNNFLMKIRFKDNEKCSFCLKVPEISIHTFWSCDFVSPFRKRVTKWLQIQYYRKPIILMEWLHWVCGQTNQNFLAQWICVVFWLVTTFGYANWRNLYRTWTIFCFSWNPNIHWTQKIKPQKDGNLLQHKYAVYKLRCNT